MNWLFEKEQVYSTASNPSLKEGVDLATENRYRNEAISFIMSICDKMNIRYSTMATSCVLLHRFFMLKSFKKFSRWEVATACLFLGGKVEETPKKSKDVYATAISILKDLGRVDVANHYTMDIFLSYERILLQTLKFDLYVRQPYGHLVKVAKTIHGSKDTVNEIVQMAWSFLNDSHSLPLCIIYPPEFIAISAFYLAFLAKYHQTLKKIENNESSGTETIEFPEADWWGECIKISVPYYGEDFNNIHSDNYGLGGEITQKLPQGTTLYSMDHVKDICQQIKSLYDKDAFNFDIN